MCGLSAFYTTDDSKIDLKLKLKLSLDKIQHRGPDHVDSVIVNRATGGGFVGLGHVRLSILDLSISGNQPIYSPCGKVILIYNGEIYNYLELKRDLEEYKFTGKSDSEVLLAYYLKFGVAGFAKLRGMFAFIFFNVETDEMIIVRDQLGVKPIYYAKTTSTFQFSSEIKGLRPFFSSPLAIDPDSIYEFLSCGFVYEPNTGFEGIKKIPPGCYARIKDNDMEIVKYFDINADSQDRVYSDSLIPQAIQGQLMSDVRVGVFFSGGTDSTVLAAIAKKECVFSRNGESEYLGSGIVNDEPYAIRIADQLNLNLIKATIDEEKNDVESILESMKSVAIGTEELISDYTFIASANLSKVARENGFKVMLSGMGGDEVFLGYPRYRLLLNDNLYNAIFKIVQIKFVKKILTKSPNISKKIERFIGYFEEDEFVLKYSRLLGYFSRDEIKSLVGANVYKKHTISYIERLTKLLNGFENDKPITKALILDLHGFLSHNLMVADKSSMREGLELRVPFLDQDLYCSHLSELRTGKTEVLFGKIELKRFLGKFLPANLVNRKKTGFNPPLDNKIMCIGDKKILEILQNGLISDYLNFEQINKVIDRHFRGEENNTYKIWQLLYFHFWLESNNDELL